MDSKTEALLDRLFPPEAREAIREIEKNDPELAALLHAYPIGQVWARPGLPLREKSLLTIASQVALGRWDQVSLHMQSFLHLGGTRDELREVCLHLSVYCGFPATVAALKILRGLA